MGICESKKKKSAASQIYKGPAYLHVTNWPKGSKTAAAATSQTNKKPAQRRVTDWPKGLQIESLYVDLEKGSAEAVTIDGATLKPPIPFDQLARFLDYHVRGSVNYLVFNGSSGLGGVMLQLLNNLTVPARLQTDMLSFADFHSLPWPTIERIFNGETLRPEAIRFTRLRLPSGVDANKLLKLPAVCGCTHLILKLYNGYLPQLSGPPPRFDSASLIEWIKRSYGRELDLTSDYLSTGLHGFLDALMKDFLQATQAHSYRVMIKCPNIKAVAGQRVRDETLFNRLGQRMVISIRKDRSAARVMGDVEAFEVVSVLRLSPS